MFRTQSGSAAMDNARRQIRILWQDFFRQVLDGRPSPTSSYKKARSGERFPMRAVLNRLDELLWAGVSPVVLASAGAEAWRRMVEIRAAAVASTHRDLTHGARWSIA